MKDPESKALVAFTVIVITLIFISIGIPFVGVSLPKINYAQAVNPTIVNGILTATALVFGFIVYEIREIQTEMVKRFVLILIPLFFLMLAVRDYFVDAITSNNPTVYTLAWMTSAFFFVVLYQIPLIVFKEIRDREFKKS